MFFFKHRFFLSRSPLFVYHTRGENGRHICLLSTVILCAGANGYPLVEQRMGNGLDYRWPPP